MLVIVCGEDTSASRRYFQELQKNYREKGYFLQYVSPSELVEKSMDSEGAYTLFNEKKAFAIENLTKIITRKTSASLTQQLKSLTADSNLVIIDWEGGKPARQITIKDATIKEFKLSKSVFKLLDECYPGNLPSFIRLYHELTEHFEPEFLFAMLSRHMRSLILASEGALPGSTPSWQRAKLYDQAKRWTAAKLIAFYEGLARIDRNAKTNNDALSMQKSVDILSSICLR